MKTIYHNPAFPVANFAHLFVVEDAPEEMTNNVGRACYLKLQPGMSNPHEVVIDGVEVTPLWGEKTKKPTDQPRLFTVAGIQYDYRKVICYRIHAEGDEIGRCARVSDIVWLPDATEGGRHDPSQLPGR